MTKSSSTWVDRIVIEGRPTYAAILEPLERAIDVGELKPGERLPAQRQLADKLGVDLAIVTRAYSTARAHGLIERTVGRGTFVRFPAGEIPKSFVDLSFADPPTPPGCSVGALITQTTSELMRGADFRGLMHYQSYSTTESECAAAARWLIPFLGQMDGARVLMTAGAQAALAATLATICQPGDAVVADPLTHSGFIWVARQFGLRTIACPVDAEGFQPEALERICATERPAAIYVVPTNQNPTAMTMPLDRRRAIAAVAAAANVWVVEADALSPLLSEPLPAIASLAPDQTFYISTLSKCIGAGLRLGFLVPPEAWLMRVSDGVQALTYGAPRLSSAIFAKWVEEGAATDLIDATRLEVRARRRIASMNLPQARGGPNASFVWLPMPSRRASERLALLALERGLRFPTEEGFALDDDSPAGVRLSLGPAADHAKLEGALRTINELVPQAMPLAVPLVL